MTRNVEIRVRSTKAYRALGFEAISAPRDQL
jgi:hypothetical protein